MLWLDSDALFLAKVLKTKTTYWKLIKFLPCYHISIREKNLNNLKGNLG